MYDVLGQCLRRTLTLHTLNGTRRDGVQSSVTPTSAATMCWSILLLMGTLWSSSSITMHMPIAHTKAV